MTYQLDTIPTARTCWVDSITGDDVTGEKGNAKQQFQTIAAALAVCVSGDACVLRPGTYLESALTVPSGVTISGAEGYGVTRVGDVAAGADIFTLSDGSTIAGVGILCPSALGTAGISYSGGVGGTASIYNIQLNGDGAAGQADGISKTGAGKIIGAEVRADTGGLRSVVVVDTGVVALESIHVPTGAGVIDAVARAEGTGRLQLSDFNVGSPTVTDALYCDGTSTVLVFSVNTFNCANSIHIASDGITLSVLGGRMDQAQFAVVVDPALTGAGSVVRITADHQPVYSFPPAVVDSDFGFAFFQGQDNLRYSQRRTFGADVAVGFAERGSSVYSGEGPPYSFGIKVVTSDATGFGGLVDVTAAAQTITGSTFSFQGAAAGHRIYFGSLRSDSTGTPLKHWGGRVIQSLAGTGGTYRFLYFSSATGAFEEVPAQAVNEAEGYRYSDAFFLRQDTEIIQYGLDSASPWGQTVVDGVSAFWVCVEIVAPPAVVPVFETWWLLPSFGQSNDRGQNFQVGLSKFRQTLVAAGNVFGETGGVVTSAVPVGAGGIPTGWTHVSPNSRLNQNGDAIYHQLALPDGICTAFPLNIYLLYTLQGGQPVTLAPAMICSLLVAPVVGNLIADPAGGVVPVPRTFAATATLTAAAGQTSTATLDGGTAIPAVLNNRAFFAEFGPFSIGSGRYEGDIILLRLELDNDGTPNQDVTAFALIVEGVKFASGSVL
ncbi:MAG: hypothetical protein GY772_17430 [bacterium]|nr:hypothetical protein [bacterium]